MANLGFADKVFSTTKLGLVAAVLADEGIVPADTLNGVLVCPEELESATTRISLSQLVTAYRNAARLSTDSHLPYRIGSRVHVSAYGMYGFALLCSADFRRTMEFAMKYHPLATPLADISFKEEGVVASWTLNPMLYPGMDQQLYRFITELQIGTHIALHRDVMGQTFAPREITLSYPTASDFRLTNELVGCPVSFNQPANMIIFDSKWLDEHPKFGNRTTYASIEVLCDGLLSDLTARTGAAGRIRRLILEDIANRPTFSATAKLLGTTTRTLRRQLQQQNTSFRDLLDELRGQVAMKYIRETVLTNEDIAFALGFSDAANFRHAFRRWTGKTPSEFRRAVGATGKPVFSG